MSARLKRSRSSSPWMRPDVDTIEDVIPVDIVGPLAGATPIVGSQSTHGWQRQPHVHTEPALPLASGECHDPINIGET